MSFLILGCGYLGKRVGQQWRTAGLRVAALTRGRGEGLRTLGIDPIIGDVTDPTSLALPVADTVLYAIGMDRQAGKSMREVYLRGLENVLNRLPVPGRLIYVSSTSVYGQSDGNWVDEDSPTQPVEESGRVVLECEELLHSRIPDAVILRFAGIYGPGRILRRSTIEQGESFATDPAGWLNLIHVEDGVRAVVAAARNAVRGSIFNVSDGSPVRRVDFYRETARLLGAPEPRIEPRPEPTNRRIHNDRMRRELAVDLAFPDYRSGLRQAIGMTATGS